MKKKQMDNDEKPKITTSLPYVQGVTEPIKRVLQRIGVGVATKPIFPLSSKFPKLKDCVLDHEKSGLVYQISCCDCDAVYIGETGRSVTTRKRVHVDAVKNLDVKNQALCQEISFMSTALCQLYVNMSRNQLLCQRQEISFMTRIT